MKRGAFEISFAWLFAILIGGFILFIAIFASVKLINIGETQASAQTGTEIGILLNPLETGFESGTKAAFSIPVETRIYGSCDLEGNFGRQLISVSQKSFNKWTETDLEVQFLNKYIFNEEYVEGKNFYLFSKPFEFPFKVADLIYLISSEESYCFFEPPEEIENQIDGLGIFQINNCSSNSIKICFESSEDCDINVDYKSKSVSKKTGKVYFETDALMYGAIFAEKEIYECQLKRLMMKIKEIIDIYEDKMVITSREGCGYNLESDLSALKLMIGKVESSANLGFSLTTLVDGMKDKNRYASECKLW